MGSHSTKDLVTRFINLGIVKGFWKSEVVLNLYGNSVEGLRIDCVCWGRDGFVYLIEAKKKLDLKALGQLLGYRHLFSKEYKVSNSIIKLVAVCLEFEERIKEIFEHYGIKVIKLP